MGREKYAMRNILVSVFLVLAVVCVYAGVYQHDFILLDDDVYVVENDIVRKGLTIEGLAWAFRAVHAGNWHPLTWFSHMLDIWPLKGIIIPLSGAVQPVSPDFVIRRLVFPPACR